MTGQNFSFTRWLKFERENKPNVSVHSEDDWYDPESMSLLDGTQEMRFQQEHGFEP